MSLVRGMCSADRRGNRMDPGRRGARMRVEPGELMYLGSRWLRMLRNFCDYRSRNRRDGSGTPIPPQQTHFKTRKHGSSKMLRVFVTERGRTCERKPCTIQRGGEVTPGVEQMGQMRRPFVTLRMECTARIPLVRRNGVCLRRPT